MSQMGRQDFSVGCGILPEVKCLRYQTKNKKVSKETFIDLFAFSVYSTIDLNMYLCTME